MLGAFSIAAFIVLRRLTSSARNLDLLAWATNLNGHAMVADQGVSGLAYTSLMALTVTICGSSGAVVGTLDLLHFVVSAFLDKFTLVVNQSGSGFADTDLATALVTVMLVPGTICALSLRDLVVAALVNRFTRATNPCVAIFTHTGRVTVMLKCSALQAAIFSTLNINLFMGRAFLLTPIVDP